MYLNIFTHSSELTIADADNADMKCATDFRSDKLSSLTSFRLSIIGICRY